MVEQPCIRARDAQQHVSQRCRARKTGGDVNFEQRVSRAMGSVIQQDIAEVRARLEAGESVVFLDVREPDELAAGVIDPSVAIPRGDLEREIEGKVPDKATPIVAYCASGKRSIVAAHQLGQLGYSKVVSLREGFDAWQQLGLPTRSDSDLSPAELQRYSRHLRLPQVGLQGQVKLLNSRVLLVGVGGLGSPAALYLAAAGVGTIGLVDDDVVDRSNLQRQVVHRDADVGRPKVDSAADALLALNPDLDVVRYPVRLVSSNIDGILADGWDVVLDGGDNFATRYLVNDACVKHDIPLVHGSVHRFEGQVTVFIPHDGPCYRCLFPDPPGSDAAPNCQEAGVLGVLPGTIGVMQASEALKILLKVGNLLKGRLLIYDALDASFRELGLARDPSCPACGDGVVVTQYPDYDEFCSR